MRLAAIVLGALALLLIEAQPAHAQRGYARYRNSNVAAMTPFGPIYTPRGAQQIMLRQQRAMAQQYQQMQRQRQAFDKWLKTQKAKKDKGQPTDPMYDQYLRMQAEQQAAAARFAAPRSRSRR